MPGKTSIAIMTAALLMAGAAQAEEAGALKRPDAVVFAPGDPTALTPEEMEDLSGGQGVVVEVLTRQQLSGSTSGNSVTAGTVTSGAVNFAPGALDGFNGVGNFVINTGANNTLQGAISISVVTTPGG